MTVINGAIGKSPAIDKMNQRKKEQVKKGIAEEMEQLICEKSNKRKGDNKT